MFYVDQFVYVNKMRGSHPGEKFAFTLVTMMICLAAKNPLVHVMVGGIMLGFLAFRAKIPRHVIAKLMLIPVGFLVIGVITVAISFSPSEAGFLAGFKIGSCYLGVTGKSLEMAGRILLQTFSLVTCLYFLALTVPMVELIYVLQSLRLPALLIELMVLIYRFIFVFIEIAFNIYTAQSSRWGYCSFKKSMYSFGILFANLWGKVFFKSQALFNSMLSRGYEGEIRVLNPHYRVSLINIFIFCLIDIGLIVLAFL